MRLPSIPRAWIIGALALFLALLSGCSLLRMTYPQLPTITYWWLDGYVDFTSAQTPRVQQQLADLLQWHRSTQLPDYATLLRRARGELPLDTTPAQICRWADELTARLNIAYEQALPAAAEAALALSAAQMEHVRTSSTRTTRSSARTSCSPRPKSA